MERSVRVARATGLRFGAFSSSYALTPECFGLLCPAVMSETELFDVVQNVNEAIQQFWPCLPVYFFGLCCAPCSFGLSLICPNMCVGKAEESALRALEQLSLKAVYYDRGIRFRLAKRWFTSSIECSFPATLLENGGSGSSTPLLVDAPPLPPPPHPPKRGLGSLSLSTSGGGNSSSNKWE